MHRHAQTHLQRHKLDVCQDHLIAWVSSLQPGSHIQPHALFNISGKSMDWNLPLSVNHAVDCKPFTTVINQIYTCSLICKGCIHGLYLVSYMKCDNFISPSSVQICSWNHCGHQSFRENSILLFFFFFFLEKRKSDAIEDYFWMCLLLFSSNVSFIFFHFEMCVSV